eukprot:comp11418_c0_seq1/m.5812 comp11418_c0_seq1/g.5812  ORF comp11418_c0_seq1/g.5812 comp11418_c0_seq1/m.5812 type:complete len:408 (-) comp11418_c0_seq1:427-1650(-)
MCFLRTIVGAILCFFGCHVLAQKHPFGSHSSKHAVGVIRPQATNLDTATKAFYLSWKARHLKKGCGGYYIVQQEGFVVSEAIGYGMLIAVNMAGVDPDAKVILDGLYAFSRLHPSTINADLMAWTQNPQTCKNRVEEGKDSATDGDLDIAYALLAAGKQWGDAKYINAAKKIIAASKASTMDPKNRYMLLGDWVGTGAEFKKFSRGSDFMPQHFRSFAKFFATSAPDLTAWARVSNNTYTYFSTIQSKYAPKSGLIPDFFQISVSNQASPVPGQILESKNDKDYYYNSCRVPWRVSLDYIYNRDSRAKEIANKIANFAKTSAKGKPSGIFAGYSLDGKPLPGSNYQSGAFIAPMAVAAMVDPTHQIWLNTLWGWLVAQKAGAGYFEDTLQMLVMLAVSQNWIVPEKV